VRILIFLLRFSYTFHSAFAGKRQASLSGSLPFVLYLRRGAANAKVSGKCARRALTPK
jgi:hypothetical protein